MTALSHHLDDTTSVRESVRTRRFLPEVQALRALAVALVVIYHVWPTRLPGGFIGVDVFFAISGFLITAHLMREHEATGTISLSRFWARRIRRLLPAAFTVLAASVALAFFVLPEVARAQTLRQVAAASGYVLNWVLGFDAVDYLAADNAPTIVQHYWTLSVEEQFYIGWPVLLVVVGLLVTRAFRQRASAVSIAGWSALAVVVLSLAYSLYLTWFNPPFAYFATTTRAWEFAAGGLLAAVFVRWPNVVDRIRYSRVGALSLPTIAGIALIVIASFILNEQSPFPGILAALPVLGALLVILGGEPGGLGVGTVARARPVQFLGDISYSVYLWHWPLLMTLVILAGRRPTVWEGLAIVIATVALATATKYFVEDPGRRSRLLSRRGVAFGFALAGIMAFAGIWAGTSATVAYHAAETARAQEALAADTTGCFGAHAMLGQSVCPDPFVLSSDVDLGFAAGDYNWQGWCLTWFNEDWRSCEFGDPGAQRTWALVGDSHAASLVEAFDGYFADQGIRIETFTRFGCTGLGYTPDLGDTVVDQNVQVELDCLTWSDRVRAELASRDDIDTVVYISRAGIYPSSDRVVPLTVEDAVATWQQVIDSGKTVISLKDWPITDGQNVPECLAAHVGETAPCSRPREDAIPPDILDDAIARLGGEVESIDMTDAFCDDTTCYSVIGNVVVYPDTNHITGTYSRTLMPYLGPLLLEAAER